MMFSNHDIEMKETKSADITDVIKHFKYPNMPNFSNLINLLKQENLLTETIVNLLIDIEHHFNNFDIEFGLKYLAIYNILEKLKSANLFNLDNCILLLKKPASSFDKINYFISELPMTQKNYKNIVKYASYYNFITRNLSCNYVGWEYNLVRDNLSQEEFDQAIIEIKSFNNNLKIAFLMGNHSKYGEQSSVRFFTKSPLSDVKSLLPEIFDYLLCRKIYGNKAIGIYEKSLTTSTFLFFNRIKKRH